MKEPKPNTITIMFNGQVIVGQEPTQEDHKFVATVIQLHRDWVNDGRPLSNQG